MKHFVLAVSIMLGILPTGSRGEVQDSGPNGFSLATEVTIAAPRAEVWAAAVGEIGHWWNSEHTISGDAANLSIDPVAQGCFCEAIGAHASVVHLTVTFVNPGVMLRLTGGSGPSACSASTATWCGSSSTRGRAHACASATPSAVIGRAAWMRWLCPSTV